MMREGWPPRTSGVETTLPYFLAWSSTRCGWARHAGAMLPNHYTPFARASAKVLTSAELQRNSQLPLARLGVMPQCRRQNSTAKRPAVKRATKKVPRATSIVYFTVSRRACPVACSLLIR